MPNDERTAPASASPWRVGKPTNSESIFEGDQFRATCVTREEAHRIVGLLNAKPEQPPVTAQRVREIANVVAECDAEDLLLVAAWLERTR